MQTLELPVIQAPMAGVQDLRLALAVAEAGGVGSVPCAMLGREELGAVLQRVATLPFPINLNFFCHAMPAPDEARERRWREALAPYRREFDIADEAPVAAASRRPIDEATVELLAAYRPRRVSFHFGLPEPALIARIKAWGATILASATTLDEARWLEQRGVDAVIAQGIEAGGHRGHFLDDDLAKQPGTRELVAQCVRALRVPVIAAGGIATRGDVAAMLALGARAVQAGSAYLRCNEATTSSVHRAALRAERVDTAVTNVFTGRPARGIVNRLMRELGALSPLPPDFPTAAAALAALRMRAEAQGNGDFSPLWCGTNPPRTEGESAATITRRLAGVQG